jgi:hypothetical protein
MIGNHADVTNTKIIGNLIQNGASSGVEAMAPVIFRDNIVRNNDQQGLDLALLPTGIAYRTDIVENNVFADNGYNGIAAGAGNDSLAVIRNNNFYNSDEMTFVDGSAIVSNATFTSASANFTSGDVGATIVIPNVGNSNANDTLVTTIASINSSTSVELTTAPSVTRTSLSYSLFRKKNVYYDGTITSGNTFTSATAKFTSGDVGKTITIYSSDGPTPSVLGTYTINAYTSITTVTISASPGTFSGRTFIVKRNLGKQQRAVYISNDSTIHYEGNRVYGMNIETLNATSANSILKNNFEFGSANPKYDPVSNWSAVPATAASSGVTGQEAYDAGFVYICVGTNVWKRVALSTW